MGTRVYVGNSGSNPGLRVISTASGWMIEGETTGDGKADFSIAVLDPTHTIGWSSDDFLLVA